MQRCYDAVMRTTVTLPDDVYRTVASLAALKKISLGGAIAELIREGGSPRVTVDTSGVFPTFNVPPGTKSFTIEDVLAAEDED